MTYNPKNDKSNSVVDRRNIWYQVDDGQALMFHAGSAGLMSSVGVNPGNIDDLSECQLWKAETDGVSNLVAGMTGGHNTHIGYLPVIHAIIKTPPSLSNCRIWCGFHYSNNGHLADYNNFAAYSSAYGPSPGFGVSFSQPAGNTSWQMRSTDGMTESVVDKGLPVLTDYLTDIYVEAFKESGAIKVRAFVNQEFAGEIATDLPPLTNDVHPNDLWPQVLIGNSTTATIIKVKKIRLADC